VAETHIYLEEMLSIYEKSSKEKSNPGVSSGQLLEGFRVSSDAGSPTLFGRYGFSKGEGLEVLNKRFVRESREIDTGGSSGGTS